MAKKKKVHWSKLQLAKLKAQLAECRETKLLNMTAREISKALDDNDKFMAATAPTALDDALERAASEQNAAPFPWEIK